MSLQIEQLVTVDGILQACEGVPLLLPADDRDRDPKKSKENRKLLVALKTGVLRVYAQKDVFLECTIPIKSNTIQLQLIPKTSLVAIISNDACYIYNLSTRQLELKTPAKKTCRVLMMAVSDHKLCLVCDDKSLKVIRVSGNSKLTQTMDIRTPAKVLGIVAVNNGFVALLGFKSATGYGFKARSSQSTTKVQLWFVEDESQDIVASPHSSRIPVPQRLPMRHLYNFPQYDLNQPFLITSIDEYVLIGCSTGTTLLRYNDRDFSLVNETHKRCHSLSTGVTESTNISVFLALLENELCIINPVSGAVLATQKIGDYSINGQLLFTTSEISRATCDISIQYLKSNAEGASLAVKMESDDPEIIQLQLSYAGQILAADPTESVRIFTQIETGDSSYKIHDQVLDYLEPYIAAHTDSPAQNEEHPDTGSVHVARRRDSDDAASIRSSGTVSSTFSSYKNKNTRHMLDSVASYLAFTRRKLRLAQKDADPRLDTALLRCYLAMHSPLIGPLLRSSNACDVEVVKTSLLKLNKWKELVWFLRSKHDDASHRTGLDLILLYMDKADVDKEIVQFIEQAKPQLDTLFEYTKPILKHNDEAVKRLFFELPLPASVMSDLAAVYHFLAANISNEVAGKFALLCYGLPTDSQEVNEEAIKYLAETDPDRCILEVEKCSTPFRPQVLMDNETIPLKARAILHSQAGDSCGAIDLYLALEDLSHAEEVAVKAKLSSYLLDKLVQIPHLLARFLGSSHESCVDPEDLLEKLPSSTLYNEVSEFLVHAIVEAYTTTTKVSTQAVAAQVSLAELSIELSQLRQRHFEVGIHDTCYICHKRLGKAVLGTTDLGMAHYACMR